MKFFEKPFTLENVKSQYRALVKLHHPDKQGKHSDFLALQREYNNLCGLLGATEPSPDTTEAATELATEPRPENIFDWEIEERPIYDHTGRLILGYKALYNDKKNTLLSVCTHKYKPTSNAKFTEMAYFFADELGADANKIATKEFADGRKLMAWLPLPTVEIANHYYDKYMMIGNSNDGSSTFFIGHTSTMIRCKNQFTQKNQQHKAYHTTNHTEQLRQVRQAVLSQEQHAARLKEKIEKMALTSFSKSEKTEFIKKVLALPPSSAVPLSTQKTRQVEKLEEAIWKETSALGQNVHGLFEAATYYATHQIAESQRTFGNAHGHGQTLTARAFEYCSELIK